MRDENICAESYPWIDVSAVPELSPDRPLLLFGAGQGTVELLQYFRQRSIQPPIAAIADNDVSTWGKTLQGIRIIPPDSISAFDFQRILVTTISGKETVSAQLTRRGYRNPEDFLAIGRYPCSSDKNINLFLSYNGVFSFAKPGARILHVGPGGFLGFECCLRSLGYSLVSMDAYSFGAVYPDVTDKWAQYQRSLEQLLAFPRPAEENARIAERFHSLFHRRYGRVLFDAQQIPYYFPHRFSHIPLEDASVDVVVSFAVLEHVRSPEKALREIHRVLKPGGASVQRIITTDHRSFGQVEGYHPFSYLTHSDLEWEEINKNKFYQNRLLPHDWRALFKQHFTVVLYEELTKRRLSDDDYAEIEKYRPDLSRELLCALDCDIIAYKQ
jgi:SAM-dependent methyltransferase